jgi:hypothetical protein
MTKEARAIHAAMKPQVWLVSGEQPSTTRIIIKGAAVGHDSFLSRIPKNPKKRSTEHWVPVTKTILVPDHVANDLITAASKGGLRIHSRRNGNWVGPQTQTDVRLVAGRGRGTLILDNIYGFGPNGQTSGTRVQYGVKDARTLGLKFTGGKWNESPRRAVTTRPREALRKSNRTGGGVWNPGVWLTNATASLNDRRAVQNPQIPEWTVPALEQKSVQ